MLTESQKRALRAKTLLDMGGHDPKTVARECGYTSLNAMLGAIAMCDGLRESAPAGGTSSVTADAATPSPKGKAYRASSLTPTTDGVELKATIYPVESGKIIIRKPDISISYRPGGKIGPTVHINDVSGERRSGHPRWLALVGKAVGGKPGIIRMLRQISEAASECAALIEDEIKGGR